MNDNQIIIPEGWTYFAHRSNTARWKEDPFNTKKITVEKIMSVVTESDINQELMHYGRNHLQGYSTGEGEPFELRCLICRVPYIKTFDDEFELKNVMLKEFYFDRRNFGGCYGQRHHSIPPKEELVVIAVGEYDEIFDQEKKIIWTIPKRFLDLYIEDIKKGHNKMIDLKKQEDINKSTRAI